MATAKKLDEKHQKILRQLQAEQDNKQCFECPTRAPGFVNLTNNTFLCMRCSGLVREVNHRVKSISAGSFTPEEIKALQEGGNGVAPQIWLATWKPSDYPAPNGTDVAQLKEWLRLKYVVKRWSLVDGMPNPQLQQKRASMQAQRSSISFTPSAVFTSGDHHQQNQHQQNQQQQYQQQQQPDLFSLAQHSQGQARQMPQPIAEADDFFSSNSQATFSPVSASSNSNYQSPTRPSFEMADSFQQKAQRAPSATQPTFAAFSSQPQSQNDFFADFGSAPQQPTAAQKAFNPAPAPANDFFATMNQPQQQSFSQSPTQNLFATQNSFQQSASMPFAQSPIAQSQFQVQPSPKNQLQTSMSSPSPASPSSDKYDIFRELGSDAQPASIFAAPKPAVNAQPQQSSVFGAQTTGANPFQSSFPSQSQAAPGSAFSAFSNPFAQQAAPTQTQQQPTGANPFAAFQQLQQTSSFQQQQQASSFQQAASPSSAAFNPFSIQAPAQSAPAVQPLGINPFANFSAQPAPQPQQQQGSLGTPRLSSEMTFGTGQQSNPFAAFGNVSSQSQQQASPVPQQQQRVDPFAGFGF